MILASTQWFFSVSTLIIGLPIRDDEARVVSHLAEARGEDGGDVVEGLEGGQELVAALVVTMMMIMMIMMTMMMITMTKIMLMMI